MSTRTVLLLCFSVGSACAREPVVAEAAEVTSLPVAAIHHGLPQQEPELVWVASRDADASRSPISLATSDGQALRLVSLRADVVLRDPIAFTELRMEFENPERRQREGTFAIALPAEAALARVAMKIGDLWQEGEVVARERARNVYEDYLYRRPQVDPLLLEHEVGQRFSARVFPILPREKKEIVIAYTETLGESPYQLRLSGLGQVGQLHVRVQTEGAHDEGRLEHTKERGRVLELEARDHTPDGDLVVRLADERHDGVDPGRPAAAAIAGDLVVARVPVPASLESDPVEGLTILVDTSASAAADRDRLERLALLLEALPHAESLPIAVLCFDQRAVEVFRGAASRFRTDAVPRIEARGTLGATDLGRALDTAATRAPLHRLLLVTDGLVTAGETTTAGLQPSLERLAAAGVSRLDVLAPDDANHPLLRWLATSAFSRPGVVVGHDADPAIVARSLGRVSLAATKVQIDGALFHWPETLTGLQPGGSVTIVAQLETPWLERVRIAFSDPSLAAHDIEAVAVERPLVERAVVAGRIARLRAAAAEPDVDPSLAAHVAERVLQLSTRHRLVTEETAFLVLESDWERARYGLSRDDLPDIVTMVDGELKVLDRSATRPSDRGPLADLLIAQQSGHFLASPYGGAFAAGNDDEDVWGGLTGTEIGEAFGIGGLGLVGTGRGGGGVGEGTIGLGAHGLIGRGSGTGTGSGYGRGSGAGFGGRGSVAIGRPQASPSDEALAFADLAESPRLTVPEGGTPAPAAEPIDGAREQPAPKRPTGLRSNAIIRARGWSGVRVSTQHGDHDGALDRDVTRRIVRAHINEARHCADQVFAHRPRLRRSAELELTIAGSGHVEKVRTVESDGEQLGECLTRAARRWTFPEQRASTKTLIRWRFELLGRGPQKAQRPARTRDASPNGAVTRKIAKGDAAGALEAARRMVAEAPGDAHGLLTLGDAARSAGDVELAARAFGSVIDLWPSRAPLRRAAAQRLAALDAASLELARDSLTKAASDRPDHVTGHRQLAIAALRTGDLRAAFAALERGVTGIGSSNPWSRFRGADGLVAEELRLVGSIWAMRHPEDREEIERRLEARGLAIDPHPSTHVVLHWESDVSDLDLHLERIDGRRRQPLSPMVDVSDGFGPEYWIEDPQATSPVRHLRARVHAYDLGAVGPTAGLLQVVTHDGNGNVTITDHPFTIMRQHQIVDLGVIELPTEAA